MKNLFPNLLFLLLTASLLLYPQTAPSFRLKQSVIDAGHVTMPVNNIGNLLTVGQYSTYALIPATSNKMIVFDHGLTIIGKMNSSVNGLLNEWVSPYSVGPIINGVPAVYSPLSDTSRYGPFKISRGDTQAKNPDISRWPKDLGAPADANGNPLIYGDQSVWTVYNGADTARRPFVLKNDPAHATLPLEIRQLYYAYKNPPTGSPTVMKDAVFMEWQIINKGNAQIDSCYIGFWTDIDFNPDASTIPAVDTSLGLGYCWTARDTAYGTTLNNPITVGYTLLYGPHVPSAGDTAVVGSRRIAGERNLPMTSFRGIHDDSFPDSSEFGPPYSLGTLWNVARGLNQRGILMIDSSTGNVTKFMYSGDPVTKTGWTFPFDYTGGGGGFIFFSGPVTMAPEDTQWILIALVPNIGKDRLQSVTGLRLKTALLREMSITEIRGISNSVTDSSSSMYKPVYHDLFQNYPNPFNPSTTITYDVGAETNVEISVYSILGQKVAALVNDRKPIGRYSAVFNADGLAAGMYIYRMNINGINLNRKLVILR